MTAGRQIHCCKEFELVAESPEWVVINKPPHLQVHPSKPDGSYTLWHGLRELLAFEMVNGGQISIINRLDRETSGLVLVCKTAQSAREFAKLMQRHKIRKVYWALVWGWPAWERLEIEAPIGRQGDFCETRIYLKQAVHPEGAPAQTTVEVVGHFRCPTSNGERFSLLRVHPRTGRMHQIRVHLAHVGHPIVGDKIYGPDEGCYLEFIETGWTRSLEDRLLLPRHALHSGELIIEECGLHWQASLAPDIAAFMAGGSPAVA